MNEWHPQESELAQASQTNLDQTLADHLRWCSRCRGVVADHEWLDGQMAAVLDAGLQEVAVPKPDWEGLQWRLGRLPRRAVEAQLLAVAGVAVIACLMLVAPSLVGRGIPPDRALAPAAVAVRVPVSTDAHRPDVGARPSLTKTPGSSASGHPSVSLPFVPPPEPPQPEA